MLFNPLPLDGGWVPGFFVRSVRRERDRVEERATSLPWSSMVKYIAASRAPVLPVPQGCGLVQSLHPALTLLSSNRLQYKNKPPTHLHSPRWIDGEGVFLYIFMQCRF